MINKDYSHIKQGMYVLSAEIKDEVTWRDIKDAFIQAGVAWYSAYDCNLRFQGFKEGSDGYYGWDSADDLFLSSNLDDYEDPLRVSVDFILNGPKEEEEGSVIKVGDYVEVVDTGYSYTTYQQMADAMCLGRFLSKDGRFPKFEEAYKVIALKKHPDSSTTTLLGIEAKGGDHYIMGLEGVKKLYKVVEKDDTMFKVGEVYQCGDVKVKVIYLTEDKERVVGIEVSEKEEEFAYVGLWCADTGDYDWDNLTKFNYNLEPIKDNTETLKEIEELKERIKQLEGSL